MIFTVFEVKVAGFTCKRKLNTTIQDKVVEDVKKTNLQFVLMFLVKMSEEKLTNTKKNTIDAVIWTAEKQFKTSHLTGCLTRT